MPDDFPRPCTTASAWPIFFISPRTTVNGCGTGVANVICVPPLKSMPRLSPFVASEAALTTRITPEIANQSTRRRMKSMCRNLSPCVPCAPMKLGFANQRKPASSPSIARVAATAVSSESTVPIRSMSAKPFTPAVATAKRTSAVMHVTAFASRIVCRPFEYPAAIAARTDLPVLTSSLIRSKMTTFASAATPIVRIRPAKPGSVSVTLKSRIVA